MKTIVTVVLEKRTPKKKVKDSDPSVYPIKLRITQGKTQRYFSLPHSKTGGIPFEATEEEWIKINQAGARGRLRDIKIRIPIIIKEAEDLIAEMEVFSFTGFRERFYAQGTQVRKNLYDFFEEYISQLRNDGRISTADSYECSMNSFKQFDPDMDFEVVDKNYLDGYEAWFLGREKRSKDGTVKRNSLTTVGIYTRSLRTIFNIAIRAGATNNYPFGKANFTPPSGENIKKALNMEDIQKILRYPAVNKSPYDRARDLWVFSYFSNGMNITDICSLKEKNIKGDMDTIEFVREKTKLSRISRQKKIEVQIIPETKAIIKKWCTFKKDPDNYIFPFYKKEFDAERKRRTVKQLVKTTNKYLRKISAELELPMIITSYHARHSFASILKESGAPMEYISESLGHASVQTTESYVKSFSTVHKQKWADVLRGNRPADEPKNDDSK